MKISYRSTRSTKSSPVSYKHTVYNNLAPDGGLYTPKDIPSLSIKDIEALAKLNYPDLFYEIISLFISKDDIPRKDLKELVSKTYITGNNFDSSSIIDIKQCSPDVYIAELFHGRSWTFKDIAMTFLANVLDYFSAQRKKHNHLFVVTSGDTGSAAVEALKNKHNLTLHVLYPDNHCSKIQTQLMTTVTANNVHVYRCQSEMPVLDFAVTAILNDDGLDKRGFDRMTVNSSNWTRVMAQTVNYFYAYFRACVTIGKQVNVHIPAGGLGNSTAGYFAKQMGLPINIVMCCNENGIADKILKTGNLCIPPNVQHTSSCAIDITYPVNLERILSNLWIGDISNFCRIFDKYLQLDEVKLPDDVIAKLRSTFSAATVSEDDVMHTMKRCHSDLGYTIDPHTAVGVATALDITDKEDRYGLKHLSDSPSICLATASPDKFPEGLELAGIKQSMSDRMVEVMSRPQADNVTLIEANDNVFNRLKQAIQETGK